MSDKQKDYLSTREAADLLGVAVSTVQLWTNNGLLRAWTTGGGHRRIARTSVEEILQQQRAISDSVPESQMSVVVVEDSEQQLRLYKKQFQVWQMNANVVTAKDGYEGLVKIGQTLPDIIITDLKMPNMDGFQMIRALKEMSELAHCLIIVVSGLDDAEIQARGGLPDGVHVYTKPIPFEHLEQLIRQKVHSRAA